MGTKGTGHMPGAQAVQYERHGASRKMSKLYADGAVNR